MHARVSLAVHGCPHRGRCHHPARHALCCRGCRHTGIHLSECWAATPLSRVGTVVIIEGTYQYNTRCTCPQNVHGRLLQDTLPLGIPCNVHIGCLSTRYGTCACSAPQAYDPSGTCRGPRVPQEVLQHAAQYAGDEGLARPSSAVPSALRAADGRSTADGAAVPEEVMQVVQRYCGGEGEARPSTAAPSVLRHGASPREPPVPVEVFQYAQQYTGEEGAARPSTAAPSMLAGVTSPHGGGPTGLGARQQRELPAPALVVHLAAQWQEGGEGLTRPATAPSSDGLRAMRASQVGVSQRCRVCTQ